jgi:dolichyl-phosphate-mannose--protein O-mannosyl transferase
MTGSQRGSTWSRQDWIAIAAVTFAAAFVRFVRLGEPATLVFDEAFYVQDACRYVLGVADACVKYAGPIPEVHPPLAKWLIAAGIRAFGYTPVGWRVAAALAGTLTVLLLYLLARELFQSTASAALASFLLVIDPLHIVHSRIGMLDIFVPLFATGALVCCAYDRPHIGYPRSSHPWRLAAGAAAGAAVAVKWPGAFALATIVILTLWWEWSARSKAGRTAALAHTFREESLSMATAFLIVPVLVYAMTYALARPVAMFTRDFWSALGQYHVYLWQYHGQFAATFPGQSPPWMWFLSLSPFRYFQEYAQFGCREVSAFTSPLWSLALVPIALMIIEAVRERNVEDAVAVILGGFAFSYLPWLVVAQSRAAVVVFYMLPTVPFLCFAIAHLSRRLRKTAVAWMLLSTAFFALCYPRMTAAAHLERLPGHQRVCAGLSVSPP